MPVRTVQFMCFFLTIIMTCCDAGPEFSIMLQPEENVSRSSIGMAVKRKERFPIRQ